MKFKLPEKIEGPQSWYGQEIKSSKEWIYTLTNQDIKEIESALKLVKNTDVAAIKRNNFPLASLGSKLRIISDDVMRHGILIGCHHGLTNIEIKYMLKVIKKFLEKYKTKKN